MKGTREVRQESVNRAGRRPVRQKAAWDPPPPPPPPSLQRRIIRRDCTWWLAVDSPPLHTKPLPDFTHLPSFLPTPAQPVHLQTQTAAAGGHHDHEAASSRRKP